MFLSKKRQFKKRLASVIMWNNLLFEAANVPEPDAEPKELNAGYLFINSAITNLHLTTANKASSA